jgi:HD-like signal output (HDOD) protein
MSASACDRSVVHVRLLRLFASPSYQPPKLPQVALEIMELSQRPEVSFDEVSAVLEKDPLLAAKVLSIAQSAVYAPRSPILSLRQATIRLGLKTLRDLVLEAAVSMRVFRAPGYGEAMERLSRHSTATAYLLRALCRRTGIDAEYAFLCGLLHDVGLAACLLAGMEPPGATAGLDQNGPELLGQACAALGLDAPALAAARAEASAILGALGAAAAA